MINDMNDVAFLLYYSGYQDHGVNFHSLILFLKAFFSPFEFFFIIFKDINGLLMLEHISGIHIQVSKNLMVFTDL